MTETTFFPYVVPIAALVLSLLAGGMVGIFVCVPAMFEKDKQIAELQSEVHTPEANAARLEGIIAIEVGAKDALQTELAALQPKKPNPTAMVSHSTGGSVLEEV